MTVRNTKMKSFKRIKRQIERTFAGIHTKEELVEYIELEIKKRDAKIESQANELEKKGKKVSPISDRYLEVFESHSSSSKLTINPCNGRITLKISEKASVDVARDLYCFAQKIRKWDKFEPVTFRGRIVYNKNKDCYCINLISESKRFNHHFEYFLGKASEENN